MNRRIARLKPSKQFPEVHYVSSQSDALSMLAARDCLVIVKRGIPRLCLMHCPCECGDTVTLNLDPRAGRSWKIREIDGVVSLSPSIWRESRCESHFFLWENAVYDCQRWPRAPARLLSEEELLQLLY
jgi:hypothetical protein